MDSTTVRGVAGGLPLLAVYAHQAQVVVAHKENEIAAAPRILRVLALPGKAVTGDALLAQGSLSQQVLEQGGDDFWVVKDNQPMLKADLALLFTEPPFGDVFDTAQEGARHGGRQEVRRLWACSALNHTVSCTFPVGFGRIG